MVTIRPAHRVRRLRGSSRVAAQFGLFGFQARYDRILAVFDLPLIGAGIIGPVENGLEVERHVGVARQQRDVNLGEPMSHRDRIDAGIPWVDRSDGSRPGNRTGRPAP